MSSFHQFPRFFLPPMPQAALRVWQQHHAKTTSKHPPVIHHTPPLLAIQLMMLRMKNVAELANQHNKPQAPAPDLTGCSRCKYQSHLFFLQNRYGLI